MCSSTWDGSSLDGSASEIIVSSVTRGLVGSSDLRFEERGRHKVKGVERPIEVFLLAI